MAFTKNSTLKEIMSYPNMGKVITLFFPENFIDLIPEELTGTPLAVVHEKIRMPWGVGYLSEELEDAANLSLDIIEGDKYVLVDVWKGAEIKNFVEDGGNIPKAWMIAPKKAEGQPRPAVICCPGGGYQSIALMGEGITLAHKMEQEEYCSFILSYRVCPNYYPAPQEDLVMAIKYVRKNAKKYNLDPENLMLMGSSAGGHLIGSVAENYKELEPELMDKLANENSELARLYKGISVRPDKLCMNYAAISLMDDTVCFDNISGGREELRDKLSLERHVTEDYPKTFLWICEDDDLIDCKVYDQMARALKEHGVEYKMHIYPTGGHGCGLAAGTSAQGWMDEMLAFMK